MTPRRLAIIAAIVIIFSLAFSTLSKAQGLREGEYIVGPGTSVMVGAPPPGTVLDDIGCVYLSAAVYKCYAGMLAGQQFTSRQELMFAWRMMMNPPVDNTPHQMAPGRGPFEGMQ